MNDNQPGADDAWPFVQATGDEPGDRGRHDADARKAFGPNAWLVDDMFERYSLDRSSVTESWREFFSDYRPAHPPLLGSESGESSRVDTAAAETIERELSSIGAVPGEPPAAAPAATAPTATAPAATAPTGASASGADSAKSGEVDERFVLRGAAARIVANMEESLEIPTATSVRTVPAKLLEVNRVILNNHLARTIGAKVSFTHLIGYALVRSLIDVPALNSSFVRSPDDKGTPGVIRHRHVGMGLAVDVEKSDGSRTLLVPCIKNADELDFKGFFLAYEDLIRKVHSSRVTPDDFSGTTITLTNPGTLGTLQSVPRLMPGQGAIIGVGALGLPAGFEAADPRVLADMGIGKVVTITSTYDHRIIQGAESGIFLSKVAERLTGGHGFYEEIFESMGVPYEPVRWQVDSATLEDSAIERGSVGHQRLVKQVRIQTLINMYRVRGHLIAHLDPLDAEPPRIHPELDPLTYGITLWDLPRRFVADSLAGRSVATLDEILHILRDAYCRTMGIEYMHIQDPAQKRWIQEHVEGVSTTISAQEQRHILERLNAAEVFERFLHTRYVGQKRFGLEGAESTIVILDAILQAAASSGITEAVIGMAHRGRLNVLANIVGKSYREIFEEFEGNLDPDSVQGSGDVKYHKGASGKFPNSAGPDLPVAVASNPSHLEAVDPVVEGMTRAKQDRILPPTDGTPDAVLDASASFPCLAVLVHGDAAFSGQGVVAETLNLSGLSGYRTGGTVHLVINNQLGFTTAPEAARTSVYPTDVAKMVQAPIFHVNGDDPEACLRAARLAFYFREEFHKDVVIDLVCYRKHGHNEGDDPSYTQPLMYKKIDEKRSVRKLYTEALVRRGDITIEEAEQSLDDFNKRLQTALDEVRAEQPQKPPHLPPDESSTPTFELPATGVDRARLSELVRAIATLPEGFSLHPKLKRQFEQREAMLAGGEVDWALGESLAFASLLSEGVDVRLTGQDTRRGTFSHRHSVLVDYETGREFVPLVHLPGELAAQGNADGNSRQVRDGGTSRMGYFTVRDSLLSEYAAVGFEYGYSVEALEALVIWEAQFGDFVNGAEIIIDNFLVAAEDKWGQSSGLVLCLPHGFEGQGPEHSSARIERFLSLCARGNMRVAVPSTASQYFHLLRSQAYLPHKTPLVISTPKSGLRAKWSRSRIDDLATGSFVDVLDDPLAGDTSRIRTVVLCSGKIAHEALGRRDELVSESAPASVAVLRVEQLYPWPHEALEEILKRYANLEEVVWLQEEPENMGAWPFAHEQLHRSLRGRYALRHVSRVRSASPATGSGALHLAEQADLLQRAIG